MIPCPNCGADNMVNAIFCRQCHKKLNLDEISPEAFDDPDDKKKGSAASRAATVIVVVVLLAIIGLLLVPAKMAANPDNLDEAAKSKAVDKFSALQSPHPGKQISFTNDEATHAAASTMGLPKTGTGNMQPTKISIAFLDNGDVKVVLQQKAFGKVPICTSVVAKPTVPAAGQIEFEVKGASVGVLPMVGPLKAKALKPLSDLFGGFQFSSAKANASAVEIKDNKGTYTFTK